MVLYSQVYCPGVAIATRVNSTSSLSHDCSELAPETSYEISVSAINGAASSDNNTINITTACEGENFNPSLSIACGVPAWWKIKYL